MTNQMLIFGFGYTASRLADSLRAKGWRVSGVKRTAVDGTIAFDDRVAISAALQSATHILSSVPPVAGSVDPVLTHYEQDIADAPAIWSGYLSSTGVYGDTGGAWVDESAAIKGRRAGRNAADVAWQGLRDDMRVFRLPGIYGPGRSAIDRVATGQAHRIDLPEQIFSRIHVDDIVSGIIASFSGPAGVYNLADDIPCSQNAVIEYAAQCLGQAPPPMQSIEQASLSPQALAFYAENRRVANHKAKRLLGWQPHYADYAAGLRACMATSNPVITNAAPLPAKTDQ